MEPSNTSTSARIALYSASAFATTHPASVLLPEALLLALLHLEGASPAPEGDEEHALFRAMMASSEKAERDGWSMRAWDVYTRAWSRARARGRQDAIASPRFDVRASPKGVALEPKSTLTAGDLVSGLTGSGRLVDALLQRHSFDLGRFDAPADPPPPALGPLDGVADDAPVEVVALDDDKTPMALVVSTFRDVFGMSDAQSVVRTYAVHFRGRASVGTFPRLDAQRRVSDAEARARKDSFPLAFELGPRR